MRPTRSALVGWLVARLARLRFPTLFVVTAILFVVDLVMPDVIPFADEILLGLGTALLGTWRRRRGETPPTATGSGSAPARRPGE